MNGRLTHIDLFAGIGGFSLASRWAGFRTIAFCEKDEWCQKVLAKNSGAEVVADAESRESGEQTEPQGWEDTGGGSEEVSIANTNQQRLERLPSGSEQGVRSRSERRGSIPLYPDIKTFPGHLYRGATLLTGGFPCQPFSCAGKRKGTEDDRDLWPFMFDVIKDARPTWIIGENVAGFVKMELDRSISDLESEGYAVRTFIIPACATDAKHRRDRCWIVAHNNAIRCDMRGLEGQGIYGNDGQIQVTGSCPADQCEDVADPMREGSSPKRDGDREQGRFRESSEDVPNTERTGLEGSDATGNTRTAGCVAEHGQGRREANRREFESPLGLLADGLPPGLAGWCEWPKEPEEVPRVAVGVQDRVNKLKGLGNAIVPQVAYEIINALARVEREGKGRKYEMS